MPGALATPDVAAVATAHASAADAERLANLDAFGGVAAVVAEVKRQLHDIIPDAMERTGKFITEKRMLLKLQDDKTRCKYDVDGTIQAAVFEAIDEHYSYLEIVAGRRGRAEEMKAAARATYDDKVTQVMTTLGRAIFDGAPVAVHLGAARQRHADAARDLEASMNRIEHELAALMSGEQPSTPSTPSTRRNVRTRR